MFQDVGRGEIEVGVTGEVNVKTMMDEGYPVIAIDPEAFMGLESFKKTAGAILRDLRNSQKAPGCERIYTAGEKEYDTWCERKVTGVKINAAVQKEMIAVRDELGLTQYKFPFED